MALQPIACLDCGCTINSDGSRTWCPSCLSPKPEHNEIDILNQQVATLTRQRENLRDELKALLEFGEDMFCDDTKKAIQRVLDAN